MFLRNCKPICYMGCFVWLLFVFDTAIVRLGHTDCISLFKRYFMPDKQTIEKAKKDKAEGKSASTQAGEFVHAEMDKIRQGEHGARSTKQAIAIGLSEARRAGVG